MNAPLDYRATAEPRVLLSGVGWDDYVAIGRIFHDRPSLRLTYDRGALEIMTTSPEHERVKKLLARLIETLAEEYGMEVATAGNMTFRSGDLARGLEADDCFWIAAEARMRTRDDWVAGEDPPPDLVLEVEISRSAVPRMPLYAALGVREVWRCDGETVQVHVLQPDGTYGTVEESPTFPGIRVAEMIGFLRPAERAGYLAVIRAFREWVRQRRGK
jgi:Uma2 family endonuclease